MALWTSREQVFTEVDGEQVPLSTAILAEQVVENEGIEALRGPTGPAGPTGPGVPPAGSTGQLLRKSSATDFETSWTTVSAASLGAATTASALGVVRHGSAPATARPSEYATVVWIGRDEPTQRAAGDLWVKTP